MAGGTGTVNTFQEMENMNTYSEYTTKSRKLARRSTGAVNGTISGDTFTRKVKYGKHFVWKHKGYGIDALQLEALRSAGIIHMRFIEDTGREYVTTVSEFWEQGVRDQLGGFEPQIFFPVSAMSEIKPLEYLSKAVTGVKYEHNGETFTHVPDYKQETIF